MFRFPRRQIAIPGVERELAVLPRLVPLLPVPIPEPQFVGRPSERFRWPFFGAALLPGVEAADAELSDGAREELGAELGRFLRALHDVELDVELPIDPNRRADMPFRVERARASIAEAADLFRPSERIESILDEAAQLPPSEDTVLVHGDLHQRHLLIREHRLAAVIDWGDVCLGEASIDLQLAWCVLPPAGRARFVEEYGRSTAVASYAHVRLRSTSARCSRRMPTRSGMRDLERESVSGLERTLVDWD